jgi:hypothetical protein
VLCKPKTSQKKHTTEKTKTLNQKLRALRLVVVFAASVSFRKAPKIVRKIARRISLFAIIHSGHTQDIENPETSNN